MSSKASIQTLNSQAAEQLMHLARLMHTRNHRATQARVVMMCALPLVAAGLMGWRARPVVGLVVSAGLRSGLRFATKLMREAG